MEHRELELELFDKDTKAKEKGRISVKLDLESIRSSPRDGLSTSFRLTKGTLEHELGLSYEELLMI